MRDIEQETKFRLGCISDTPTQITNCFDIYEIFEDCIKIYKRQHKHTPATQTVERKQGTSMQRMSILMDAIKHSEETDSVVMCYAGLDALTSSKCEGYTFGHARLKDDLDMGLIFDHWITMKGLMCRVRDKKLRRHAFKDKKCVAVWRGNRSGVGQWQHDQRKIHREHFCDYFKTDSRIDAQIAKWQHDTTHVTREEMSDTYKYLIHLEGNDTGSDIYWVFSNQNVVFMPEHYMWNTVWHMYLKPWTHFVPFKFRENKNTGEIDTDLPEKIEWCEANQDKCVEIIHNANKLNDHMLNVDTERRVLEQMFITYNNNILL